KFFSVSNKINSTNPSTEFKFPYQFKGLKNFESLPIGKTFHNFDQFRFNYDEYNANKDPNFFAFWRSKLKINNRVEEIMNKKFEIFTNELVTVLNREYSQTESKLDSVLDLNFYSKLIYQDPKYFRKSESQYRA